MAKPQSKKVASAVLGGAPMKSTGKHAPASERKHQLVIGDHVVANDRAPRNLRGRDGFITEITPGKPEYRVEFDDGQQPTTGYLMAPWLEPVTS